MERKSKYMNKKKHKAAFKLSISSSTYGPNALVMLL